jgi:hypothetical protein
MATIIRIEDGEGLGPFSSYTLQPMTQLLPGACRRHWDYSPECEDNHVKPPDEEGLNIRKDGKEWFCGLKTLGRFNSLFRPEEAKILVDEGYKIYVMTVDDIQQSVNQVLYTLDNVKSKVEITSIFK